MRAIRTRASALPAAVLMYVGTGLIGCAKCPDTMVPMDQLVDEYNANAARVPRLWARAKIAATITTPDGVSLPWGSASPLATPNGLLVLEKGPSKLGPHYFVLVGRELNHELFRVGSHVDEGVYYFWYRFGKYGRAWVGRNKLAGAPGVTGLPMDPSQLLAVLSVCELPTDFTDAPTVAMTMDSDPANCAYVLTYIDRQPVTRRLGFRREVYFHWGKDKPPPCLSGAVDKKQRRPFMVKFFDNRGVRIMTAHLDKYKPVEPGEDAPDGAAPPTMPTDIRIDWPAKKSRVHIVLSEMTARRKGNPRKAARFEAYKPEPVPVVLVDAHIRTPGGDP